MNYREALTELAEYGPRREPDEIFDQASRAPHVTPTATAPRRLILAAIAIVALAGGVAATVLISNRSRSTAVPSDTRSEATPTVTPTTTMTTLLPSPVSTSPVSASPVTSDPVASIPPFTGDEEPACRELAAHTRDVVPAEAKIVVGKPIGWPSQGCELWFEVAGQTTLSIASTAPDVRGFGPTGDGDETNELWPTGTRAYIDPSGPDSNGGSGDARVALVRNDGHVLTVTTYNAGALDDAAEALGIAHALDQSVDAATSEP